MREAAFVRQNKDKWDRFEAAIYGKIRINPRELADLYVEVTDHLSYANTFYPGSETALYLNRLAALAHQKIYKTRKEPRKRMITFWKTEMPQLYFNYQRHLLISFLFFGFFAFVGAYSASEEGDFVRGILGDAYVNMTLENIENGDPMAVYKEHGALDMFLGITINNVRVAFMAYVAGALLGLGTLYILMFNGIMLGSFQYFFFEQGLLWESARTIWIHGTIEIFVIVVAGSAGLIMAEGILFPRSFTRLESFKQGTRNGLKVLVSTVPFFVIAGFLEGFVTRYTEMPDVLAILIIGGSLAFMLFYYVYYPRTFRLARETQSL